MSAEPLEPGRPFPWWQRPSVVADVDIIKERDYISRYQIRLMPTQVFVGGQSSSPGHGW